ncbi:hypothetical protein OROHE_003180 [Orobanche hederae]
MCLGHVKFKLGDLRSVLTNFEKVLEDLAYYHPTKIGQ